MDLHVLPALIGILLVLDVTFGQTSPEVPEVLSTANIEDLLYPYGPAIDTISPKSDDGGSPLISTSRPIPLFGQSFSSLYVNNNGLLSFGLPISQYVPQALPIGTGFPFLAIFWSDVDNRLEGDIYYRESTDSDLLSRATSDIRTYFHDVHFSAQWVFVATWHRVPYLGSKTNKVNTFQAVLITDGNKTFLLYNYGDIQWPSIRADGYSQDGPSALAGLNSGDYTGYYTLPGSFSTAIVSISSTSNVNEGIEGRWAFRVDGLHPEETNGNMGLLYPYGSSIDTINPKIDDGGSPVIYLSGHIPLFGRHYSYLYVNNNGLLSFVSPINQFVPQALPVAFGNPFLAIFWSDIDNRLAGDIYYRQSTDPDLLSQATSDIIAYFPDVNFTAEWVFVATWHRVAYYSSSTNKVNTFQAVLSTDGDQTFLLYNYADIQWPSINEAGRLALAGLNSGYDTGYYTLPGSLSRNIKYLSSTSNVNVTGRWAFKVDGLRPEDVNGDIDEPTENEDSTDIPLRSTSEPPVRTTPEPFTTRTPTTVSPFIRSTALLYPYGSLIDIVNPKIDDGGSQEIYSSREIPLFGSYYFYLYVNNNGLLSFCSPISQWTPQALPVAFGNPFLAIFWSDIHNGIAGDIYYRESTDPDLLSRATSDITSYFDNVSFVAKWVFVATWHRVAYYSSSTNKVNTFQAVLSTDGDQTFLLYNYEDIQWPSMHENNFYQDGPLALAGLNSGYDTGYYTLPGSLSLSIKNLSSTSNVNVTGRWAFKVDGLHPEDVNGNIDESTENENPTDIPWTTTPRPPLTTTCGPPLTTTPRPPLTTTPRLTWRTTPGPTLITTPEPPLETTPEQTTTRTSTTSSPSITSTGPSSTTKTTTVTSRETTRTTSTASKLSTVGFFLICLTSFIVSL